MLEPLRRNLDGFHDPTQDVVRTIDQRTRAAMSSARDAATDLRTPADLHRLQDRIRGAVLAGIGGPLPPEPGPVEVTDRGLPVLPKGTPYRIERTLLTTRPGVHVPTVVYVPTAPADTGNGAPALVFLSGHEEQAKAAPDYQRVCGLFAAHGYVVAAFDPHGLGERYSYVDPDGTARIAPGTTEHTYAGLPCWWAGLSPARYFLDDARRVIDYLQQRPDVDPNHIVATGASGGGTLTSFLMALEPRLAGAAPATAITSRLAYLPTGGRQDAEQILLGASSAGVDHDWLLMAMAPRPVCVLTAEWDFFPIEGTLDSVHHARQAWEVSGRPENLHLLQVQAPHRYHPRMAQGAIEFFTRALGLPHRPPVSPEQIPILSAQELQCTRTGQVRTDDHRAAAIPERLTAELTRLPVQRDISAARTWLQQRVRANREPVPARVRSLSVDDGWHLLWRNEAQIWACGVLSGNEPVHRILLLDQGSADLAPGQERPNGTLVLDVRARGILAPYDRDGRHPADQASATYKLLSDLLWLDDSLAAGQVWDVIRAIDTFAAGGVHLSGTGYGAYLARLTAFCDPRVRSLRLDEEYLDPTRFVTERYYDEGRGAWHGIIPGLLQHAPWPIITAATDALLGRDPGG